MTTDTTQAALLQALSALCAEKAQVLLQPAGTVRTGRLAQLSAQIAEIQKMLKP